MLRWTLPVYLLLALACAGKKDASESDDTAPVARDMDGDGFTFDEDCDDRDASIKPTGVEECDGVDEDCDGLVDGDDPDLVDGVTLYRDVDSDGFGDPATARVGCAEGDGYVLDDTDCDDLDPDVNPDSTEECDDADVDEDCSGAADDQDGSATNTSTYYRDQDGDGFGNADAPVEACDPSDLAVTNAVDCDDTDPTLGERADWYRDSDGDGYGDAADSRSTCEHPSGYARDDSDCDDHDAAVNPGAVEVCDGEDDDCDGAVDDDDASVDLSGASTWYLDADGDGYGDGAGALACALAGGVTTDGDCDDAESSVNPSASDTCNDGVDSDCSGSGTGCTFVDTTLSSSTAEFMAYGEDADDYAGTAVAGIGDWDGDGYDDIAIGATGDDDGGSGKGAIYIVDGGRTGSLDLASAYAKLYGESSNYALGQAVSAGDIDGDGAVDLVAGGDGASGTTGIVYIVYGPVSGTHEIASVSGVATILGATGELDDCGHAVSAGRDVSGDGRDDVVFGCGGADVVGLNSGAAYVVTNAPSGDSDVTASAWLELAGESGSDEAGTSVSLAEDLDGDGYDDVLVGAPGDNRVYVVLGPVTADRSLGSADVELNGSSGDYGTAVAGLGDTDGDGYGDAAFSKVNVASGGSYYGDVSLHTGGSSAISGTRYVRLSGTPASSSYDEGWSIAGVGDVDDDGNADMLVGAPLLSVGGSASGGAYLVNGPVSGSGSLEDYPRLLGTAANDRAGWAVGAAGDFDGSGVDDLVIGASREDSGASSAGAAYVVLGAGL